MSPKRRIRPEDLKPERGASTSKRQAPSLPYPAGGPDPPEVAAMEEAMVPTLPLRAYLALATAMLAALPRLRSGRFISEMMGLGLYAAPVLITGVASGIWGDTQNSLDQAATAVAATAPQLSSNGTVAAFLSFLVAGVLWLVLKSTVDAHTYSLLRGAVSGSDSLNHPGRKKTLAFFAANLLQLAIATGVALFIGPVILRMITMSMVSHELSLGVGLILPLTLGVMMLTGVRVLSMFVTAWITWRPVFIAGAIGAAFAAPIRDARIFWGSFVLLGTVVSVASLAIALCAAGMYLPTLDVAVPPVLLQVCMVGTFVVLMQVISWFDVGIVASVGHQVGEYSIARTKDEAERLRAAALKANLGRPEQQVLHAAPTGMFRAGDALAQRQPIRFEDLLGYRPSDGDRERWALRSEPIQEPLQATQSGGKEVSLRFESASGTMQTEPVKNEDTALHSHRWFSPSVGDDAQQARGFARLHSSLLPATVRTSNGQPERRFHGIRTTTRNDVATATPIPLDADEQL